MTQPRTNQGHPHGHSAGAIARLGSFVCWTLSAALAVAVGVAVACEAYLEKSHGLEYAQWHVGRQYWFGGLLAALALSLFAATLFALPWRWKRPALALAPLGTAVVAAGLFQTWLNGIEGRTSLWQGTTVRSVDLVHRSRLTLLSSADKGAKDAVATELSFAPGPADWQGDRPVEFDEVDGVRLRVLQFYRHGRFVPGCVADESPSAPAAVQVAISDPKRPVPLERWVLSNVFGSMTPPGHIDVSLFTTTLPALRDEFLKPPAMTPGSLGILSAHYQGRVFPIAVDGNKGKKVPLGDTGVSVEIVDYFANTVSKKEGFSSAGTEPKNPMLQLRVHVPGQPQPIASFAYSNKPFVTPESMKRPAAPVTFWYHHPAAEVFPGVEFLQTPDGKLCCRVGAGKAYQPRAEVKVGDRIPVGQDREVALRAHFLHARPQGRFESIPAPPGEPGDEAAALIELTAGEKTQQFWLRRNDPQLGAWRIQTPGGPRLVMFGYEKRPLDFSVKLVEVRREPPSDDSPREAFESQWHIFRGDPEQAAISADNPLRTMTADSPMRYGDFTFSQLGVEPMGGRSNLLLTTIRVTSNPGRWLQYAGVTMLCVGVLLGVYYRLVARRAAAGAADATADKGVTDRPATPKSADADGAAESANVAAAKD